MDTQQNLQSTHGAQQDSSNPLYCEELALTEMRQAYQNCNATTDNLDRKAIALLSSASLILALFGILQLKPFDRGQTDLYWVVLSTALVLYFVMLGLCAYVIAPRRYNTPIKADKEVLGGSILCKPPREAVMTLLSGYVEQIQHNRLSNQKKAFPIKCACGCLAGLVLALVALSVIQSLGL